MSALPLRPALADVLAVLTNTLPLQWSPESYRVTVVNPGWVGRRHPPQGMSVDGGVPLIITDPAEAFESLITHGVLPDSWAEDLRLAWSCEACRGRGVVMRSGHAGPTPAACLHCAGGCLSHPASIPALVAWASLGPAAILRAEELALHGAHLLTIRPPVVVWRVAPLTPVPQDTMLWQVERQRKLCGEGVLAPCDALYEMGLAWVYADDHAVTIVVPPVGAP